MSKVHPANSVAPLPLWALRVREGAGLLYVLLSVALSGYALTVLAPYCENDLFWPDFTTFNTSETLVDVLNAQLRLHSTVSEFDLTAPTSALVFGADAPGAPPTYPRRLLYDELTTITAAIDGLRRMQTSSVATMMTQYCWADLGRVWSMAHTPIRQARCAASYSSNAAVYLEAVLRNIDFHAWIDAHGAYFNASIAAPVSRSEAGLRWLDALYAHVWLPPDAESDLWTAHELRHFTLAYTNAVQTGIQETIAVTNALGGKYSLLIKSIPFVERGTLGTATYLFGGLLYDFESVAPNGTLIGAVDATAIEYYIVGYPFSSVQLAVHSGLGPWGSVDLTWVAPPPALVATVDLFRATVLANAASDSSFLATLEAVVGAGATKLHPTPLPWANDALLFSGGNPMCGNGVPLPFVQENFGFDDGCGTQEPLAVPWTPLNALFAVVVTGVEANGSFCSLCSGDEVAWCHAWLNTTAVAAAAIPGFFLLPPATDDLTSIAMLQFVSPRTAPGNVTLSTHPLLSDDWAFFGWMGLYDWAIGDREVVTFAGDVRAVTLLSYAYAPYVLPVVVSVGSAGTSLLFIAGLVTFLLAFVASIVVAMWTRHRPDAYPWWYFNRIVASVWLSRTMLLLRGGAAALCLATTPLVPAPSRLTTGLRHAPRSLLASAILAGETTWILYALHEVGHPITRRYTHAYASWNSFVSFGLALVLDVVMTTEAVPATITRACALINMGDNINCASASIDIGSSKLLGTLALLNVSGFVVCALVARAQQPHREFVVRTARHALVPTMATAFLPDRAIALDNASRNCVTAAMCGLFGVKVHGRLQLFDTKLWRLLDSTRFTRGPSLATLGSRAPPATLPWFCRWPRTMLALGFVYLAATLASNFVYLSVAAAYFANDFGWRGFNASGVYPFIGNLFASQLLVTTSRRLRLDDASLGDIQKLYNASVTLISTSATAARRQLYRPGNPVADAIADLRRMQPCLLPWMFTQYCFLDLNQTWHMASTPARQMRCAQRHGSNGAVYLETGLRNLNDWPAWLGCWGASFEVGIARHLATSVRGRSWLTAVTTNERSITAETADWAAHGITSFVLQWQNYKTLGLSDAIVISTALGLSYLMPITATEGATHVYQQTSMRMYWTFASDLWAVASNATEIASLSLLSDSPGYAFANTTAETLLLQNLTLTAPLRAGLECLRSAVGPFGAVDMVYVFPPPSLLELYAAFTAALSTWTLQHPSAQEKFTQLPLRPKIAEASSALLADPSIMLVGGNVLCGDDLPPYKATNGIDLAFSVDNLCHAVFLDYMKPGTVGLLFALAGYGSSLPSFASSADVAAICALDAYAGRSCAADYGEMLAFVREVLDPKALAPLVNATVAAVLAVGVEVVQYLAANHSGVSIYRVNLLEPSDRPWTFYGWCFLYEWISGSREVVAFEGDAGTVTTISARADPVHLSPDPGRTPTYLSVVFRHALVGITTTLIGVALALLLYTLAYKGAVEGSNLFEVNRIVGIVWIGRPSLLLRAVTAIMLLNTSPLDLVLVGRVTHLTTPPLAWYNTVVAASEATWLVYVLNDLLSCFTRQHTTTYAYKSTFLTWLAVTAYTFVEPHVHTAAVDRRCSAVDMDAALVCISGYVHIGDVGRLANVVAICVASIALSYAGDRLWHPRLPDDVAPSLLLSAQSVYLLAFDRWVVDGEYYLDRASALMAGLVTVTWQHTLYILDIKSWRLYTVCHHVSNAHREPRLRWAIPLTRVVAT
ncbi:hypothetical protein ACHHYP_13654 [Achlya hypogyna]|uniref:Transmembrane protein n=1 Tax=Achlya hypogyna TaxID=1202772 RepID=A0A1V9ZFN4_ACHHY|nr:hypothetical protein ACHHYP_13654 [Achlya hypogyna]